jgi:mRNA interferase MazF
MRPIHVVHLDKSRPALVLTREMAAQRMDKVTIAPLTSTVKGLVSEVAVGRRNGLDRDCVVSCDNITTVPKALLGKQLGFLFDDQEAELALAIERAFDLHGRG